METKTRKLREVVQICPGTHRWCTSNELRFKSRCVPPGLMQSFYFGFILLLVCMGLYVHVCICTVWVYVCHGVHVHVEARGQPLRVNSHLLLWDLRLRLRCSSWAISLPLSFQAQISMLLLYPFHSLSLWGLLCLA